MRNLYIDYNWLHDAWGHGGVHVSKLPFANNYGAYFSASLTDVDYFEDDSMAGSSQRLIVKGARLKYYPPRFKLFTCSSGIIRPKPLRMTYAEAQKIIGDSAQTLAYTNIILSKLEDESTKELNRQTYIQYVKNNKEEFRNEEK